VKVIRKVLPEPFGNAVHASTEYDLRDRCVVVFGVGPIGLFSIIVSAAQGAARIIAVDTSAFRLGLAARVGADVILEARPAPSGDPDARARERERQNGLIRDAASPHQIDLAMEMSGHPDAIDTALKTVRRGGKWIIGRKLPATWMKTRELMALPAVRQKIQDVITHTLPFSRYREAFQEMLGRDSGKVVMRIRET
jgi:threonine 3-dehydrogenase